jgi:hypothetical protein
MPPTYRIPIVWLQPWLFGSGWLMDETGKVAKGEVWRDLLPLQTSPLSASDQPNLASHRLSGMLLPNQFAQ